MQQIERRSLEPDATDLGEEMAIYGYARVSSDDQDLTVQREALKAAGCEVIREEKVSGGSREGRKELETLLAFLRPGDTLIVTKLDRLARSTLDMLTLITDLGKRGIGVRSLAERDIDTTTAAGKLMLTVFAAVAQFERERIKERQAEGIKRAKENGVYKGGKPRIDRAEVARLKAEGLNPTQIAGKLDINRVTVYRILGQAEGACAITTGSAA